MKEPSQTKDELLNSIEQFLAELLQKLEPQTETTGSRGRPRVLPALCLWGGMLVCVLRGFSSQLSLWRLLRLKGLWSYPRFLVSDQAVYKRLAEGGTAELEQLFGQVSAVLSEHLAPYEQRQLAPFATAVVALDETTLDPVARMLPSLREVPKGDSQLLPGKLAGVFDIRKQQWVTLQHVASPHQNEKVAAPALLQTVPRGSLLLQDLGYFSFQWFDDLTDGGYYWISRLRRKTSYKPVHTYYEAGDTFDGLVWLGAHRADRAAHAVRLVRFKVGTQLKEYITNVTDPQQLSLKEIATLYARRWDIEMAVKAVKRYLDLHLLWSSKTDVILQQVWAVFIIAQIFHALQLEVAGKAGVDPFDVSLPLLIEYYPFFAADGSDPVAIFVQHGREGRFIRPSRRIRIRAPIIPLENLTPLPANTPLARSPRYAKRRC